MTCTIGGNTVTSPATVPLVAGANTITVTCTDVYGSATDSVIVNRGTAATVEITFPADGASTTEAVGNVYFNAAGTAPVACTLNGDVAVSPVAVPLTVGANLITVNCSNGYGNETKEITVNRGVAPTVAITTPVNGFETVASSTAVEFETTGTAPVTCTAAGSTVTSPATLALTAGANSIVVSCSNDYGSASATVNITRLVPASVQIISPIDGFSTTSASTNVQFIATGTAPVACTVGGDPVTSPANVPLVVGANSIEVSCSNDHGSDSDSITINRIVPDVPVLPPPFTPPKDDATPEPKESFSVAVPRRLNVSEMLYAKVKCSDGCWIRMQLTTGRERVIIKTVWLDASRKVRRMNFKLSKRLQKSIRVARRNDVRVLYKAMIQTNAESRASAAGRYR